MAAPLLQAAGGTVALGRELGRGGEGAVFEIAGKPDVVAKIYHAPPSPEKSAKLLAMLQLSTPQVLSLTAWPRDVLRGRDGRIHGLLMSNIAGFKDIHSLYGPKSRRVEFPDADWRHLVRAAANIARAFAVLHEVGCVIGDVNHGGIRVSGDMTVKLIDCDSFQVQESGGRTFFCEVGVENFTPPELQGRPLRGVRRTPNHDNFGLAVMVFYLLMIGRHPFAGRYLGKGDMPIEKAIAEHRYAYGRQAKVNLMAPPPFAPSVLDASDDVAALWERAFAPDASTTLARPSAREWISSLAALEKSVLRCKQHLGHYHSAARSCPWCVIESSTGTLLFFTPIGAGSTNGLFNLVAVWSRIAQVTPPGPVPEISIPTLEASQAAIDFGRLRFKRKLIGRSAIILALSFALTVEPSFLILWLISAVCAWAGVGRWAHSERTFAAVRRTHQEADEKLRQLREQLNAESDSQQFALRLKLLEGKRAELQSLPHVRTQRLNVLIKDREKNARERFLEGWRIETAKISGVGPAKRAMLQSYQIETAADVVHAAILEVPGFGPALAARLEEWRADLERAFRFDPRAEVDRRDLQELDRKIAQERSSLEHALLQGEKELSQIRQQISLRREALLASAVPFAEAFAQAEADWKALTGQS